MPTPILIDSFQHRVLEPSFPAANIIGWVGSVQDASTPPVHDGTSFTYNAANARTTDHAVALKLVYSATVQTSIERQLPAGSKVLVGSFYFKTDTTTNPSTGNITLTHINPTGGTAAAVRLNTSGQIVYLMAGGSPQTIATDFCDATWHRVDFKYDCTTTSGTLDVSVDGNAGTQATGTVVVADQVRSRIGNNGAEEAYTVYFSDWVASHTSGDYPIGDHICRMLTLNGTGTHSQGSGAFQDEAGNTTDAELLNSVDDAWDGTTPELSQTGEDFVRQTANDGAGYVEFTFTDPTESTIWAAQLGVLMASLDATTANNCEARLVHSGTTYATTGLIDPSISATAYSGYRVINSSTPGGDGWSGTELSAATIRFGFSTDAAPDALLNSAIIEYVAPWSASTQLVVQDATHAHAADNVALTQHNVLAVQDALHAHAADNVVLVPNLIVQDALHAHAADNLTLTAHDPGGASLVVQDATHAHAADNLALTQHNVLVVADALHSHSADNVVLDPNAIPLVVQDAAHAHAADNLVLTQHNVLVVQDARHTHTADNVVLQGVAGEVPPFEDPTGDDGQPDSPRLNKYDVTAANWAQRWSEYKAYHDALTGEKE